MTRRTLRKHIQRVLAVMMSITLVMSSSSFQVLADTVEATATESSTAAETGTENTEISETVTTGDGTLDSPTTTVTTTTTEDPNTGNTTTTVDVTISASGTDENGAQVTTDSIEETVTVTDSEGEILAHAEADAGKETTTKTSTETTTGQVDQTPEDHTSTETTTTTNTETGTPQDIHEPQTTTSTTRIDDVELGYGGDISVTVTQDPDGKPATATNTNELDKEDLADQFITTPDGSAPDTAIDGNTGKQTTTETTVTPNETGYESTTTVTTTETDTTSETQSTGTTTDTTTGSMTTETKTVTEIVLPTRPTAGETIDPTTGNKTVVTVEDLTNADGTVIGYRTMTTVFDATGNQIGSGHEDLMGTKTTTTTTESTPTTTTTTSGTQTTNTTRTETETQITETDVSIIGTGRTVTATLDPVTEGEGHGSVTTSSLKPDQNISPKEGEYNYSEDLHNPDEKLEGELADGYDFVYRGDSDLESTIRVKQGSDQQLVRQFILTDEDGNEHFVYCADFGTSARSGYSYNMENVEFATYYTDDEAKKITTIAQNGFWGTSEGVGSLEELQKSLTAALAEAENPEDFPLTQDQIDNLTYGQAITATQAAIWVYGNSLENERMDRENIAGKTKVQYRNELQTDTTDQAAVNGLYQYLLSLPASTDDTPTTFLDTNNFATSATLTIGQLSTDGENLLLENTDDDDTNDTYDASLDFTLAIEPSAIDGDLIVTLFDGDGNTVCVRRLAGDDSQTKYGMLEQNANGSYTITNLQLTEGIDIRLNLSGTQNLDHGVYLYSSQMKNRQTSQTFVGIANGTRKVNLDVTLDFNVDEPTAAVETVETKRTTRQTDTVTETSTTVTKETAVMADVTVKTDVEEKTERIWDHSSSYTKSADTTPETPDPPKDPDPPKTPDTPDPSDDPDPPRRRDDNDDPVDEDPTPSEPEVVVIETPEVPLASTPQPVLTIDDSETPKAAIPETGDESGRWAALTWISGLLLLGLYLTDERRKNSLLK